MTACWLARLTVCAWLTITPASQLYAQDRPLDLDDVGRLTAVGGPVISPGATHIAYITSRPNYDTNRHDAQVLLLNVATRVVRVIAGDRVGVRALRWLDDDRLLFAARPDSATQTAQVIEMTLSSGVSRQLTHSVTGVRSYAVHANGAVAYTADDAPEVKTGPERFNDSFEVGNDDFLTMAAPRAAHLWVQSPGREPPRRLTNGTWSFATSLSSSALEWSPNGEQIIAQAFVSAHSGDTDKSRVVVIAAATGATSYRTDDESRAGNPTLSPDGAWIAYGRPRDGQPANMRDIHLVNAAGGAPRNVTRLLDRAVSAQWMPDGTLLLTGGDGTKVGMWRMAATPGASAVRLPLGDVVTVDDADTARDGTIAFSGSQRGRPSEIFLLAPNAAIPQQLTSHNAFLDGRTIGRTRGLEWRSTDGLRADGVVTYPANFDPARKHPLVLLIHGGPTAASYENFSARAQLMAARGWIVFQPNYRGSNNRGNAFQRAIANDPGPGIDRDVMSGIAALTKLGGVDTTRVAVSGWSFGGYVSAWLIGHHKHWKAAVVGAGAMDLFDMYTLTDLNVQLRHAITASPYVGDRQAWFRAQSPLTYAARVRTPTLILHDVRDQRVTITQSYKLYHALKDNRVPVQFIAYPIAGHSPTDPVRSRDVNRRWLQWLDKHLGDARVVGAP